MRVNNSVFNIFQDPPTIEEHEGMYRKIVNRSMSYEQFMEDKKKLCSSVNPLLKTLAGEWYHYVYGSKRFWEDKVVIYEDGRVKYYCTEQKTEEGIIINKTYQSVILLDDKVTKRIFTIIFDHQEYKIQRAFLTKCIAKQSLREFDTLTIGIFSRKQIPIEEAKKILGDVNEIRVVEKENISNNLSTYLTDTYGFLYPVERE